MKVDDNTLTAMVEAAAKGRYAEVIQLAYLDFGSRLPEWDELPPLEKNRWREAVMMTVWDAVAAMPDPRYAAWEEGKEAGHDDAMYEERGVGPDPDYPHENPYPAPEVTP